MKRMENKNYRPRVKFTRKMKKDFTVLSPAMAPIHFKILRPILQRQGYKIDIMDAEGPEVLALAQKYLHNDMCYPAMLTTGQMLATIKSGKYDPDKVAMIITQSGGGCRDSNYINLMRKAFEKAGHPNVPFISANVWGLEFNSGANLTIRSYLMALAGLIYGDMIMIVSNQVRPYEVNKGETDAMIDKWTDKIGGLFSKGRGFSVRAMKKNLKAIADDFASIKIEKTPKVKVALIGELFLKYSAPGNNHLEDFLAEQDCEVYVPSILGFGIYKTNGALEDLRLYGGKPIKRVILEIAMAYMFKMEDILISAIEDHPSFVPPERVKELKKRAKGVINVGNSMGEGWYLAAEMLEFADHGYENIVIAQPFGCLPCHVAAKGMINKVRRIDPRLNVVDIEYDPGATRVNQENRIKLMLVVAKENLAKKNEENK